MQTFRICRSGWQWASHVQHHTRRMFETLSITALIDTPVSYHAWHPGPISKRTAPRVNTRTQTEVRHSTDDECRFSMDSDGITPNPPRAHPTTDHPNRSTSVIQSVIDLSMQIALSSIVTDFGLRGGANQYVPGGLIPHVSFRFEYG